MRFSIHGRALSDLRPRQCAVCQPQQPLSDSAFCPVQTGQKHAGHFANPIGDYGALLQLELDGSPDQFLRHFEQLFGQRHQLLRRQTAMALVHRLGERVGNTGANPNHGSFLDAKFRSDSVGSLETNATNIAREPVRVLRLDLDGVRPVGLEDPHCPCRTDAVAVQEDHDLPHRLLFRPGGQNARGTDRPDAIDLA